MFRNELSLNLMLIVYFLFRSAANRKAKSYKNMAFSKHYLDQHYGQKPKLSVKILKRTKGSVERKIKEALFIQKLNPDN